MAGGELSDQTMALTPSDTDRSSDGNSQQTPANAEASPPQQLDRTMAVESLGEETGTVRLDSDQRWPQRPPPDATLPANDKADSAPPLSRGRLSV